ncbi:MAG: hypothetical protein J6J41_08855, partial [Clostridia bacterium]|nr:hypothetical protein [Clostridia bacterium]
MKKKLAVLLALCLLIQSLGLVALASEGETGTIPTEDAAVSLAELEAAVTAAEEAAGKAAEAAETAKK